MQTRFDFLETQTVYATPGVAYCVHKRLQLEAGDPVFRIPRVTAGTDRVSSVRLLANTWMRIIDNSTYEHQAAAEIVWLAKKVHPIGYSRNVLVDSWKTLAGHARYVQFCRMCGHVQRELCETRP